MYARKYMIRPCLKKFKLKGVLYCFGIKDSIIIKINESLLIMYAISRISFKIF